MKTKVPDYVSLPVVSAIGGTILFTIPLIGPLLFLPLIPLAELYDYFIPGNFGETGEHVEVDFAGITLKSIQAWMFYVSFFFIIGLIIGVLKQVTKGKTLWFLGSLICVFSIATILGVFVIKDESKQELVGFTTPTETVFVCDQSSSLELKDDGSLWKFKQQDGSFRTNTPQGNVDYSSNTFFPSSNYFGREENEHNIELIEQYKKDLNSCRNINGASISDLYSIELPDNFFKSSN